MKKIVLLFLLVVYSIKLYGIPVFTATYDNNELRVKYDLSSLTLTNSQSDVYSFKCITNIIQDL